MRSSSTSRVVAAADRFGEQLLARFEEHPGLALLDGAVEHRTPLLEVYALGRILDVVTAVAREVAPRFAAAADAPPVVAWKARVALLAERRDLRFDPARARLHGTLDGFAVEVVVEPQTRSFATTVTTTFPPHPASALAVHNTGHEVSGFGSRNARPSELPGFEVAYAPPDDARLARPGVVPALLALAAHGEVMLDETTLSATVDAVLDAPQLERLLDAALAVARAFRPPAPDPRRGGGPYR